MEYENKKKKLETFFTERTDITQLLGIDWMKRVKLTIGRILLADNNQSEKARVLNNHLKMFENNRQ